MFVAVMAAIGLFVLRLADRAPAGQTRRRGRACVRCRSRSWSPRSLGLIAIPVYLDFSTANDSLRSVFDLDRARAAVPGDRVRPGDRRPRALLRAVLPRGWDRPVGRPSRAGAAVDRGAVRARRGALLAAAAVLVVPGAAGHAAQTSPRGLTLLFDWLHLASGSVWLGGLIGLLVVWFSRSGAPSACRRCRSCVPRFSNVALGSVLVLAATGVGEAIDHMPAVNALWETGYGRGDPGQDGPARRGAADRLGQPAALASAADRRARGRPEIGEPAARLLRRLVSGEAVVVVGGGVRGRRALEPARRRRRRSRSRTRRSPRSAPGAWPRPSAAPATRCRCWSRRTRRPRRTRSRCGSRRTASRCAART